MCNSCDWETSLKLAEEVSEMADIISEEFFHDNTDAMDFAESIKAKAESIAGWIEANKHCTPAQGVALQNMKHGAERWMR